MRGFSAGQSGGHIRVRIPRGLEDLSPAYLEARRLELHQFLDLLSIQDFDRIRMLGHDIRGTGAAFGFKDLTSLGEAIEKSAAERNEARVRVALTQMEAYLTRVRF